MLKGVIQNSYKGGAFADMTKDQFVHLFSQDYKYRVLGGGSEENAKKILRKIAAILRV